MKNIHTYFIQKNTTKLHISSTIDEAAGQQENRDRKKQESNIDYQSNDVLKF